ncbi:hypothetical protein OC846_004846, partial [Tilletia horrida]
QQGNAGSFIRPSGKLELNFGVSFLQALRSRYALVPTFNVADTQPLAKHSRRNLAEIEIEVPNVDALFQKELVLERLRIVAVGSRAEAPHAEDRAESKDEVDEKEVSHAYASDGSEQAGSIKTAIPNAKELDMSRSLLPDWQEVGKITREIPHLDTLLLHFNRLARLDTPPQQDGFLEIRHLGLDGNLISWAEVIVLSECLPNLERVELRRNNLKRFFPDGKNAFAIDSGDGGRRGQMQKLKSLHLQENVLHDWLDLVAALSDLTSLEQLVLSSNHFSTIPRPNDEDDRRFSGPIEIAIDHNPLNSWSDIDALAAWCCPAVSKASKADDYLVNSSLKSLHVHGKAETGPFSQDPRDVRAISIARIPSLQSINGSAIRASDRRDAEIWYLGYVAEQRLGEEERQTIHPRFEALSKVHNFTKEDSAKRAEVEETDTLKSKLIELKVYVTHSAPPRLAEAESKGTIKLLGTSALRSSMTKLAKACGVKSRDVKDVWASLSPGEEDGDDEVDRITTCLDSPSKELSWYGLSNGDYVFVIL